MSVEKLLGEIEGRAKEIASWPADTIEITPTVRLVRDQLTLIAALRRAVTRLENLKNKSYSGWEIRDSVAFAGHSLEEVTRILQGEVQS